MQPSVQQSQTVHHRVSTPSDAPDRRPAHVSYAQSSQPVRAVQEAIVNHARQLLALLPGRAALLDSAGLVIDWNEPLSPHARYSEAEAQTRQRTIAVRLRGTGGLTLVWAPGVEGLVEPARRSSRALTASRAQICELTCRLLNAQEDERKKIARELHDDLGQRLAAHALAIGNLKRQLTDAGQLSLKERLLSLETEAVELGDAIRMISHELHPALLERLGLTGALRTFAQEFCEWSGLRLVADLETPPVPIPCPVAVTIYRVAQEALHNIERHAHATTTHLKLGFTPQHVELTIQDNGVGLAAAATDAPIGLGLTSIEERVRLLDGQLFLESAHGQGTTLSVRIPVPSGP